MALCKPHCDSNDCKLPSMVLNFLTAAVLPFLAAYHPITVQSSGVKDTLYFRILPCLAWFSASSPSNAAVIAWFTSIRTFGDSCSWLGVGRLSLYLKYRWILIPTIDSSTWLYRCVQMRTCVEHLSKIGMATCNIIHNVLPFLQFFWMQVMEKLAICNQQDLAV